MKRTLFTVALVACGGANAPPVPNDVFVAPSDTQINGECALLLMSGNASGECFARWTCVTSGVRTLTCGRLDGGISCVCVSQSAGSVNVTAPPPDCTNAAMVSAFATAQCGWTGLP